MDPRTRSRTYTRLILLTLALGAIVLVAALAFSQRPPGKTPAGLTAASPLVQSPSPLPSPTPVQGESPPAAPSIVTLPTVTPPTVAPPTVAPPTVAPALAAEAVGSEPSAADAPPTYGYRVVASYPHDPSAFTQGLHYLDGLLIEGTGLYGESSLRRVELETGEVINSVPLSDSYFGEGVVVVDDRIIQLTWESNLGFVYDLESFALLDQFSYPTEGWGITFDGQELIMSDGSATLYRWDPETLAEVGRIQVMDRGEPVVRLNELEYIEGEIWANIWQTERIARIDPETGAVVGWVDLTGLLTAQERGAGVDVLNGIAYDGETGRLFVTGKLWPTLFEIEVVEQQ